jgi:hypothetical protein
VTANHERRGKRVATRSERRVPLLWPATPFVYASASGGSNDP